MAYNNAKLCNVLFARGLARKLSIKGVCVNSLHPGNMVSSSLPRNWWFYRLLFAFVRPFTKSLVCLTNKLFDCWILLIFSSDFFLVFLFSDDSATSSEHHSVLCNGSRASWSEWTIFQQLFLL